MKLSINDLIKHFETFKTRVVEYKPAVPADMDASWADVSAANVEWQPISAR